jgi:hypothetical protein
VPPNWIPCLGCGDLHPPGPSRSGYCAQCWVDGLVPLEVAETLGPYYADYAPDLEAQAAPKRKKARRGKTR